MQQFNTKVTVDQLDEGGRTAPVAMVKVEWDTTWITWIALRADRDTRAKFGPGAFMTGHDSGSGPLGGVVLFNPWTATIQLFEPSLYRDEGIIAWGRPVDLSSVIINRDMQDELLAAFK